MIISYLKPYNWLETNEYYQIIIGLMSKVFANGLGDQGSLPGCYTKGSKNGTWYYLI